MNQRIFLPAVLGAALIYFSPGKIATAATLTYNDNVNSLVSSSGANFGSGNYVSLKIGWFLSGFTPTANNFLSWESNFRPSFSGAVGNYSADPLATGSGALGYADTAIISAQLTIGQNSGPGATDATILPPNTQVWLIGSSKDWNTTTSDGSLYASNGVDNNQIQFFAATRSDWLIPTLVDTGGGTADTILSRIASQSDVVVGQYTTATSQIAMIPEPSSGALLAFGLSIILRSFQSRVIAKRQVKAS